MDNFRFLREVIIYKSVNAELTEARKIAAQKLIQVASLLLGHGKMNIFASWSIADTDLALMLNRLIFNGDSVPDGLQEIPWWFVEQPNSTWDA